MVVISSLVLVFVGSSVLVSLLFVDSSFVLVLLFSVSVVLDSFFVVDELVG